MSYRTGWKCAEWSKFIPKCRTQGLTGAGKTGVAFFASSSLRRGSACQMICQGGQSPTTSRDGSPHQSCTIQEAARMEARGGSRRSWPYVIEFNLHTSRALPERLPRLNAPGALNGDEPAPPRPDYISKTYVRCMLTWTNGRDCLSQEWKWAARKRKMRATRSSVRTNDHSMRYRAIYKLWPDFPVQSQIYRSVATVKADAAFKSFGAAARHCLGGHRSGIDENHQHFDVASGMSSCRPEVRDLHRCFVDSESPFAGIPVWRRAFSRRPAWRRAPPTRPQVDVLYRQIGQLKVAKRFLARKLGK